MTPDIIEMLAQMLAKLDAILACLDDARGPPAVEPRYTPGEAAEIAHCHPSTIREAVRRRELAHERAGDRGRIRIPASALDAWMRRHAVSARRHRL